MAPEFDLGNDKLDDDILGTDHDKNGKSLTFYLIIRILTLYFWSIVYIQRDYNNVNLNPPLNLRRKMTQRSDVTRICITGGPCAGKTTAIASIK